jgi:hypothetical protein
MNTIQSEIKFYEKEMSAVANEIRSYVEINKKLVKLPYQTSSRPVVGMSDQQKRRFDYARKSIGELMKMKSPDERRFKELRNGMPKVEVK